ncbi:MAG: hypothetical protein ACI8TP_004165 [Acidimicrobiales bacterium]|jgi:hypothetical protein
MMTIKVKGAPAGRYVSLPCANGVQSGGDSKWLSKRPAPTGPFLRDEVDDQTWLTEHHRAGEVSDSAMK